MDFSESIFSTLLNGGNRFYIEEIDPETQTCKFCTRLIQQKSTSFLSINMGFVLVQNLHSNFVFKFDQIMKIIDDAIKLDHKYKLCNPIAVLANTTTLLEVEYDSVWRRGKNIMLLVIWGMMSERRMAVGRRQSIWIS